MQQTKVKWLFFANSIDKLQLCGVLINKQFTSEHLYKLTNINYLYIGSTNYKLFDNENIVAKELEEKRLIRGMKDELIRTMATQISLQKD